MRGIFDKPQREWADGFAVFGLALTVYLLSAPRTVLLDDDGYFILAAWFNGVAHPPGYPLYTALAHVATWLPFGTVAFRVHALSALFGALAGICVWAIARRLIEGRAFAVAAALAYAFSGTFWSQAIVAEVYSLNALFFFGLLAYTLRLSALPAPGAAGTRVFAFLYGLSLSNHWPLMILSAPALLAAWWPRRRDLVRHLPSAVVFGLLGLTPYLWMVFRSWVAEIAFQGPIETPGELWYYLSREGYRNVDVVPGAGWDDKLRFLGFTSAELARQFGPPGIVCAAAGFWRQWLEWPRHVVWAHLLAFLGSTLALIALLGFPYDLRYQNVFRVYPLIAYGIAALWLAVGLKWIVERIQAAFAERARRAFLHWGGVLVVAGTALVWNAAENYRAGDVWARNYALTVLGTLPPRARFFVSGDYATGPVAYFNLIERVRPDVTLYSFRGLLFNTRLFNALWFNAQQALEGIDRLITSGGRPVLYEPALPHGYGAVDFGLFRRVAPDQPPSISGAALDSRIQSFYEDVFDRGPPPDPSQLLHYREFMSQYCRLMAALVEHGSHATPALVTSLESRCIDYQGLLQRAEVALRADPPGPARALELLLRAEDRADEAVTYENRATLDYLLGQAYLLLGDRESAASHFAASLSSWPGEENPAYHFAHDEPGDQ